jgi:hypothetical protein
VSSVLQDANCSGGCCGHHGEDELTGAGYEQKRGIMHTCQILQVIYAAMNIILKIQQARMQVIGKGSTFDVQIFIPVKEAKWAAAIIEWLG